VFTTEAATCEFTYDSLLFPHQTAISDDGRIAVIASEQIGVIVVDMIDNKVLLETTHPSSIGNQIYLSPNGRHVAATGVLR
jgi:hypothetical protein